MLENPSSTDTSVSSDLDLELQDIAGAKTNEATTTTTTAIPDKYRDKSLEDVIAMHQNAEKLISRQGNDMAEIKRAAAVLAEHSRGNVEQTKKQTPTTVEALLDNPDQAIAAVVAASPALQQIQAKASRVDHLEQQMAYGDFVRKYPKFNEDITDDGFVQWVTKNPVRTRLAQLADQKDFNSATNLWDMWTEHKELVGTKPKGASDKVRQAATVRGAPSEAKGKPVYSRSKLDELRLKAHDGDPSAQAKLADPDFNARLVEAYQEGRVK